ncbi:MAG: PEP-CTERM sorting domain-containing protein, partial [Rubricoccaceae bacterium]|nr:PEP-CTERM sorting domain-containing protein [Rubricoccaceae bacterium]
ATLADLKTLSNATSQTPFFGFPSGVSVRSLAYVPDPIAEVPEPSTFVLLTIGLAGLGFVRLKHG